MESAGETSREREYEGLRDLKFRLSDEPACGDGEPHEWTATTMTGAYHSQRQECPASSQGPAGARSARRQGQRVGQKSRMATHGEDADVTRDQRRRGLVVVWESERESAQGVADRVDEGEISYRGHHKQQENKETYLEHDEDERWR